MGSSGLLGSAVHGRGREGVFVNAATGNLLISDQDEYLVGRGPDDAIGRTYNSLTNLADDNNDKWRQSTDRRVYGLTGTLNTAGSTVKRVSGDGTEIAYAWSASRSAYVTTDGGGAYDTIVKNGSNWVWTDSDTQTTETYDGTTTKILSLTDINGNSLTFGYDGSGRLSTVTTANGDWTRYDYSGSTQNITQIVTGYTDLATNTAKTLTRTRYGYDGSNRLTTVTVDLSPEDNAIADGKTYVTTYTYDGSGRVSNIAQSDGSNLAIVFDGSGRVSTLTETAATGVTRVTGLSYGSGFTNVTDPTGQVTRLDYAASVTATTESAMVPSMDLSSWYISNQARTSAGTLDGVPAYQFTANAANLNYFQTAPQFTVQAGETYTWEITLKGVGATNPSIGFYGDVSGWGNNAESTFQIVSGPGTVGQWVGGYGGPSGLSTTQGTRIRITRTFTAAQTVRAIIYLDSTVGAATIAAAPSFAHLIGTGPIQLTKITAPPAYSGAAQQIVQFAYNANGDVTSVTDALGKVTTYANFTANGVAQTVTDTLGNVVTRTFDAKNHLLSETHSAVDKTGVAISQTSRMVYDVNGNLRYSISPEGRVTKFNWQNGVTISVVRYLDSAYTTAGTPTEADMQTWATANVDASKATRNFYSYDARQNLVLTTEYGAFDASGAGISAEGVSQISYVYDQAGQLRSTNAAGRPAQTYVYDGLGRLTAETDLNGGTTTYVFNDPATTTTITMASGYVVTRTYNIAGDLIGATDSGSNTTGGATGFAYDRLGRVRVTTDATGLKSYAIYDNAGRHLGDVFNDAAHGTSGYYLVEYRYDADNLLVGTINYYSAVSTAILATLDNPDASINIASVRPAASTQDVSNWTVYDAEGRVLQSIAGDGSTTISIYDASGRLQYTTAYFNKISGSTIAGFVAGETPGAWIFPTADARDITARNFYDNDGRLIGVLDGEGFFTQSTYDKAGRLVASTAFATQVPAGHRQSSFLQMVVDVGSTASDRTTRFVYDARNLLRYRIDGLGRTTAYFYDSSLRKVLHESILDASLGATSDYSYANIKNMTTALEASAGARKNFYTYDTYGRLAYVTDAAGSVSSLQYDTMGNVVRQVQLAVLNSANYDQDYAALKTWVDYWIVNGTGNRITRSYFTARGEAAYTVDAEGFVTKRLFDAKGQMVRQIAWDTAISVSDTTTFAQVEALAGGTFADQYFFLDGLGRQYRRDDANGIQSVINYLGTTGLVTNSYQAVGTTDVVMDQSVYDAAGHAFQLIAAQTTTTQASYDGRGLTSSATDARANSVIYTYDLDGRVKTATNALGGVTTYEYNAFGQVWKVTDPNGSAAYSWYDRLGRVIAVQDGLGYLTTTSYTAFGEIAAVTRYMTSPGGTPAMNTPPVCSGAAATTGFTYDRQGRVLTSTDALGYVESYSYDALGQRVTKTGKEGAVTTYTYDRRGLLLTESVMAATYRFDTAGSVVGTGSAIVTKYEYDARGNRTKMIEAYGLAEARTTIYVYDKGNRLTRVDHDSVQVIGDDMVTLVTVTPSEQYAYDRRGNVIKTITGGLLSGGAWSEAVAAFAYYDVLDRKVAEIRQLSGSQAVQTAYSYDANGNLISTKVFEGNALLPTSAGGIAPAMPAGNYRQTDFTYDSLNRMATSVVVSTAGNAITSGSWNGSSYVTVTGNITTTYTYDANGNVVKLTDPSGAIIWSWFDALGQKQAQLDGEGYLTSWTYNAEGNVLSETRFATRFTGTPALASVPAPGSSANDRITLFAYDLDGNRVSEKRTGVLAWTVDAASGALSAATTTDSLITYTYNKLGQVLTKTVAGAQIAAYTYENTGRLLSEQRAAFSDANGVTVMPTTGYRYDGLGNLSRSLQSGAAGTYAAADRVTSYTYGAGGRLAAMRDAEGNSHSYSYDVAGRQKKDAYSRIVNSDTLTWSGTTTTIAEAQTTTYDLAGRVLSQALYSTIGGSFQPLGYTSFLYNNFDQVVSQGTGSNSASGMNSGTALYQVTNQYDGAGRLTGTNAGDGVWKFFGYDSLGNQTAAVTSAGTSFTSGIGFAGALAAVGGNTVNANYTIYDKRGMGTQAIEEGRDLSATVTNQTLTTARAYNAFGEVAAETNALGATVSYSYNTMGRRVRSDSPAVAITLENGLEIWVKPSEDYYYDLAGRLVAMRDAGGSYGTAANTQATAYAKAANTGNLNTLALLAGAGYDGKQALVTTEFHADGGRKQTLYDVMGDARVLRDELYLAASPNLHVSEQSFNRLGQLVQVKHNRATNVADDSTRLIDTYLSDQFGQRLQHSNNYYGTAVIEKTGYDALGRVTAQTDMAGYVTTTAYAWDGTLVTAGLGTFGGWSTTTTYANGKTGIAVNDNFQRKISQTDLGSHKTGFTYDAAGRMVEYRDITGGPSGGAAWNFVWLNIGRHKQVSASDGGITTFAYDGSGHIVAEKLIAANGTVLKDQSASFDALGRVTAWSDNGGATIAAASLVVKYDAVSNIINRQTTYRQTVGGTPITFNDWFRFDAMNRIVVDRGKLLGGVITAGIADGQTGETAGVNYYYDLAGNRVLSTRAAYYRFTGWDKWHDAYYTNLRVLLNYSTDYVYDGAGQMTQVGQTDDKFGWGEGGEPTAVTQARKVTSAYTRDLLGRASIETTATSPAATRTTSSSFNAAGQLLQAVSTEGSVTTTSTYSYVDGAGVYDLGQVASISAVQGSNTQTTTNLFAWYGGAEKLSTTVTGTGAQSPGVSSFTLDSFGQTNALTMTDGVAGTTVYIYDAASQGIVSDATYGPNTYRDNWYRMGGINMWHYSNRFDPRGGDGDASAARYTVRGGDTLGGIALTVWGDASLWYKLAEANGLTGTAELTEGQQLTIPAGVWRNQLNASTYIPYDAARFTGPTDPSALYPTPQPPKANKCGVFGQILLTVIAIAVTALTGNPVLGNLASQGVGLATGIQQKFSWGSLAMAYLTPQISAGVGSALGSGAMLGSQLVGDVVRGAVTSVVSQGIGVAIGAQDKFSWAGVAAAGIGAGIGGAVERGLSKSQGSYGKDGSWKWKTDDAGNIVGKPGFAAQTLSTAASTIANAATRSVTEGSNFGDNLLAAVPDAIGKMLGDALGRRVAAKASVRADSSGGQTDGASTDIAKSKIWDTIWKVINWPSKVVGQTVGAVLSEAVKGVNAVGGVFKSIDRNIHTQRLIDQIAPNGERPGMRDHIKDMLRVKVSDGDIERFYNQRLDMVTPPILAESQGFRFSEAQTGADSFTYETDAPDWLARFRRDVPGFSEAEDRLWNDSQSTEDWHLQLDWDPIKRTGRPAHEKALLVWRNDKDPAKIEWQVFEGKLDKKTGEYSLVEPPPWVVSRKGWTLIIVEHTHPFPWRFAGSDYRGYKRGPSGVGGDQESIRNMGNFMIGNGASVGPIGIIRAAGNTHNPGAIENYYYGERVYEPR